MHPWPSFPWPHLLHLRLAASQDAVGHNPVVPLFP